MCPRGQAPAKSGQNLYGGLVGGGRGSHKRAGQQEPYVQRPSGEGSQDTQGFRGPQVRWLEAGQDQGRRPQDSCMNRQDLDERRCF